MKLIHIVGYVFTSCSALPQLAQTMDDIETDNAIRIEVQKESLQKSTDLQIQISVTNKDKSV